MNHAFEYTNTVGDLVGLESVRRRSRLLESTRARRWGLEEPRLLSEQSYC